MEKASIVEFKETPQRKGGRRSRRGQKQPEEAIGTETKGSDDHVDDASLMIIPVEEYFSPLHSFSSPGELVNQPEEMRIVASDVGNNDSPTMVPCSEATRALVGEMVFSVTNGGEPLQMVLPQSSREPVEQAEPRTTATDANDSFTVLSSVAIIAEMEDKGALASVCEDGEPLQTLQQLLPSPHRDRQLNHPELETFSTDVCNYDSIDSALEKEASVTECRQFLQQPQHLSAHVDERQKHLEVGSPASVANNDGLIVLSVGPLTVVENMVKEKEMPEEQLPQEQQLSLQCIDDDVIKECCWNSKSLKKEKEGKPNKNSESTRRWSLRLAKQSAGEEAEAAT
ncbi:uncharacterized protein LOC122650912 [Telopea speciosissima]|uniref:uncharacterized protein LOC122650912 n=1 Tax=Telopea speciosissima TaxID=54955 RepID=UPI001CC3734C|nr:uncharacterized protein LOC122650912 [Telopea speciosissima]